MSRPNNPAVRAVVEVAFIIFLFYSNLLMGEYTRAHVPVTLTGALRDVITPANFIIALVCAFAGHLIFDALRKQS